MVNNNTPYEYGDIDTDALGEEPPHERQHGTDVVIVDGSTMSYRRYTGTEPS